MSNPFETIEDRLNHIEGLLENINQKHDPTPRSRIIPLEQFCSLGFMKPPTAYLRLSKKGNGIPGACKVGKLWFIDLDQFEESLKKGGLSSKL